jgi:DNA polymerase-4
MKDSKFNTTTRQSTLVQATDSIGCIFNRAFELFTNNYCWINPLRSIGVRAANFDDGTQMSLFDDDKHDTIHTDISSQIKRLTARFGKLGVESAGALGRWG